MPVRECIEECYGDKEIPEWFKDWKDDLSKSCVFHIGCWRLLIQHFNNGVVPLDKLAKVVKEAPWPQYRACKSLFTFLIGFCIHEQFQIINENF